MKSLLIGRLFFYFSVGASDKVDMSSCVAYGQVRAPDEIATSFNNEGVYDDI